MKNRTALILLGQILEVSQEKDRQDKVNPEIKLENKVGQSWMTFHLKQLKNLLESEK